MIFLELQIGASRQCANTGGQVRGTDAHVQTKTWEKETVTRIFPEFSGGCYMSYSSGSHFYYVKLRKRDITFNFSNEEIQIWQILNFIRDIVLRDLNWNVSPRLPDLLISMLIGRWGHIKRPPNGAWIRITYDNWAFILRLGSGPEAFSTDGLEKSAQVSDPDMPIDSLLQRSGDPKILSVCLFLPWYNINLQHHHYRSYHHVLDILISFYTTEILEWSN